MSQDLGQRFTTATGSEWYLSVDDQARLQAYLKQLEFLLPEEQVTVVAPAGEGNMNLTLRVFTNRRHFILKQSRPWVAKFPDLDAPVNRIAVEREYLTAVQRDRRLAYHSPELLRYDPDNFVLLLEDLGTEGDLTDIYRRDHRLLDGEIEQLLQYAVALHGLEPGDDYPQNLALRQLNHAHIFDLPFRPDNGFPLDALQPGLARIARPLQEDERLRARAAELGAIYLATDGSRLIHGDFYPGSFLRGEHGVYVIDGEFSFRGRPEFDLGVLLAHLLLSRAPEHQLKLLDSNYPKSADFDSSLVRDFAYVEVIRRLIGIAQLPLDLSLEERQSLLGAARSRLV